MRAPKLASYISEKVKNYAYVSTSMVLQPNLNVEPIRVRLAYVDANENEVWFLWVFFLGPLLLKFSFIS